MHRAFIRAITLPMIFVLFPTIIFAAVGAVIVDAVSADIVDFGRLVTGRESRGPLGLHFRLLAEITEARAAGLAVVGACGLNATAASQLQMDDDPRFT